MKKSLVFLALLLIPCISYSQNAIPQEEFRNLQLSVDSFYMNAGFKHIVVIDQRKDPLRIGKVKTGVLNRPSTLVFRPDLQTQLNTMLNQASAFSDTISDRTLVLVVKQLYLSEQTTLTEEKGEFTFIADVYEKKNDDYFRVALINSEYKNKRVDVTADLIKKSSEIIVDQVFSLLSAVEVSKISTTLLNITRKDSLEKAKIPLYTVSEYKDGIYMTWEAFANQTPEFKGNISRKKNTIRSVEVIDKNGTPLPVSAEKIFGVVVDGRPFVVCNKRYCPLYFIDNDYQFIGKVSKTNDEGLITSGSVMFGALGALVGSAIKVNIPYLMCLNYSDGTFNILKELRTFEEETQFDIE